MSVLEEGLICKCILDFDRYYNVIISHKDNLCNICREIFRLYKPNAKQAENEKLVEQQKDSIREFNELHIERLSRCDHIELPYA